MKKKALIVAFVGGAGWGDKPYEDEKKYDPKLLRETYAYLFLTAEKEHIKFIKTSYMWYNEKENVFEKGWIFDEKLGWIKMEKKFIPDVVFDKIISKRKRINDYKKLFSRRNMLFNPHYIEKVCTDKYETYKLFKAISPRMFKITNKTELEEKLKKIRGDRVVFKPDQGSSARGIIICKKDELLKKVKEIKEVMVLQEFVECNRNNRIRMHFGVYDIRVVLSQGKIVDSYIRASKKNVLMSNTALGGKMIFIHKEELPSGILKDLKTIEKKFKHYKSRLYTVDFVIDKKGKVWLIELNDKPGIFLQKDSYAWKKRRKRIAHAIIKNMESYEKRS
jgi:glutathione synthase/RimK-type ligase-like ATP-grasp enzyme